MSGDVSSGDNNTKHRLPNNDLSGTDGKGSLSRNGKKQLRSVHDIDIRDKRQATATDTESSTPLQESSISPAINSYETQEDTCYTFILHKEELKPLPLPGTRKGPTFAHGDHIHFLFSTKHSNNLSRPITTILQYVGASFVVIAEAHTTLQRVRYITLISYLVRYGLSSFNKYGSTTLKQLAEITKAFNKHKSTDEPDDTGQSFSNCQMYTGQKKRENIQQSYGQRTNSIDFINSLIDQYEIESFEELTQDSFKHKNSSTERCWLHRTKLSSSTYKNSYNRLSSTNHKKKNY
jgi:hypothetical protein